MAVVLLLVDRVRGSAMPAVECALNASASQEREDLLLLPTLMRAVGGLHRPGTFVELGALDGRTFSNTLMLEQCFGWTGILIEANPISFSKLNASGRTAALVHSAVCEAAGGFGGKQATVTFSLDGGETAGELTYLTKRRQRKRLKRSVEVPCEPLRSIMKRHGHSRVDFLSLDVEGQSVRVTLSA